jgi:NADPH-dependent 7-cyano-7-deazaguanine reductase QueF
MQEEHTLDLSSCCPVSKNLRPGSKITISYVPAGKSLEIASLIAYIHSFKNGWHDGTGQFVVRDMEGMICRIAQDCTNILLVPVVVKADLYLLPKQDMCLEVCRDHEHR